MNILIIGGDTRLLDYVEKTICLYQNDAQVFKKQL